MRIENDVKLDYNNVLLRPKRSRLLSRSEVTLTRKFKFPHSHMTWEGVPIVASNMDTIGTFPVAEVMARYNMLTCIHKHYSEQEWRGFAAHKSNLFPSIIMSRGLEEIDLKIRIASAVSCSVAPKFECIDVANGYSEALVEAVEKMRSERGCIIIAGNVATPEMTEELILRGADIVKVGIGPGSACTTRKVTGVGYPQLSAVIECADAAHGLDGHIMADGGCTDPGDVAKAFCGGADFVMLGGMLAGHDETGTEFYGMSSNKAQEKYGGELKDYRASEGREVTVESKGPLKDTIREILGGLRCACTYIGA
ncbi:MAG: GMP reductase, partial [Nitrosopumilus sp.]